MQKILLLASLLSITLITQAAELTYRTECIGSYTLQLPDNLEVALYPTSQYLKPKSHYPIYFADGKWAYLSRFNYNNNNLSITTKWDDNELINVKEQLDNFIQSFKIKSPNDLMELPRSKNSLGYYTKDRSSVTFIEDNKIHKFYTNSYYQGDEKDKGFEFYKKNAEAIIAGFSTRKLFEVPHSTGKCIPFGFIAGENTSIPLELTVSFRLNEHPDVIITFAENTRSFTNALNVDAEKEIRHFWNYSYDNDNDNIKGIKLLGFPKMKNIRMDGRKGKSGFVEILYKDNAPSDYGYYSVVDYYSRNSQSQINHPWLQLTVIGKQDEAKGHTPLTKDEIYQLAKTIESSITRRPTERG